MGADDRTDEEVAGLDLPLDRDVFMRTMLRHVAGTLQDAIGLDEASGFVSVVGDEVGQQLDHDYRAALGTARLEREQVAAVHVDLKRRIGGGFAVESQDDERIVYTNTACPFGDKVVGRPSLCMMTSNVFGSIAARNLGYARVELQETIAEGASGCRVVVHLDAPERGAAWEGREYFAEADER